MLSTTKKIKLPTKTAYGFLSAINLFLFSLFYKLVFFLCAVVVNYNK